MIDEIVELILNQRTLSFKDVRNCLYLRPFLGVASTVLCHRTTLIIEGINCGWSEKAAIASALDDDEWTRSMDESTINNYSLPAKIKCYEFRHSPRVPMSLRHQNILLHVDYGEDTSNKCRSLSHLRSVIDFESNVVSVKVHVAQEIYFDAVDIERLDISLDAGGTLKVGPSLLFLDIRSGSRLNIEGIAPNLKSLYINSNNQDLDGNLMGSHLESLTLAIRSQEVHAPHCEFMCLRDFSIDNISTSTTLDTLSLQKLILSMPVLKRFNIADDLLESFNLELPSLESLKICGANIKTVDFENSHMHHLQYLSIQGDVQQIAFGPLVSINVLDLSGNRRFMANLGRFSYIKSASIIFSKVKRLHLLSCHITNEDLERVADLFEGMVLHSTLSHLGLSQNLLLNLRCFREGLYSQLPLRYLDLSLNRFKFLTDYTFPLTIKQFPHLHINMKANPIERISSDTPPIMK